MSSTMSTMLAAPPAAAVNDPAPREMTKKRAGDAKATATATATATVTATATATATARQCRKSVLRPVADALGRVAHLLRLFWLFTKDDFATFVGPNTMFGLCGAFAGSLLITPPPNDPDPPSTLTILGRFPLVVFFNWSNLLVFDLANQRLPESVREDALNKPWRPVPRGLLTPDQVRRAMLVVIPTVWALNHFVLGVGAETAMLLVGTWAYNDLRGGDEGFLLRNAMISLAFALYNTGSLKVAGGSYRGFSLEALRAGWDWHLRLMPGPQVTPTGTAWLSMVSGVVLTTMHVQDLKDQAGDKARGRRSAPLILGNRIARWSIAVPVGVWSCVCMAYWAVGLGNLLGIGQALLGAVVAYRCVACSGKGSDRKTWELWALWTVLLYTLPLASTWVLE